ncbi:DNA repair protein RecN [Coriobacteriia bacterium Es71-Z0120]|uniref:DNA repair protein RecN n=1 Tax=Parvivirga hydrogeniphila TaxID=2939460 RepID=UPI002260F7A7|nr:DNA repair protein RecN [Parvivirga hydrogeniphila]MCL4079132.1 DNA repair protein RecN [Parvivirga hydrogeniphila]
MLLELHVKDLALVEEVWLEFGPGLTALTGETGAGKTVLVGALKLLLGERADATAVREGASEALVEGRFLVGSEEHVVKRRIGRDGRSRCLVDGEMATVGALAELLGDVVDLHGQHEHQSLISPARHAAFLDRYLGEAAEEALAAYRRAFDERRDAERALEELRSAAAERESRVEQLRSVLDEVAALDPRPGEDAEIEERLARLRHADRLATAAEEAWSALKSDGAALDLLGTAEHALASAAQLDPSLAALLDEVRTISERVNDIGLELKSYEAALEHDPAALERLEERHAALRQLARRHGGTLEAALQAAAHARAELDRLESVEDSLDAAARRLTAAVRGLEDAGGGLSALRREGATRFAEALREAAADLALPKAVFDVAFEDLPFERWTREGPHRLEFLFASSGAERPRPLAKIASGGEMSRVMLALKSVLGAADRTPVLVFDEVDAGIGGATALAVGRRLKALAASHQVLVVTHLAQVAAYADRHVVVEKRHGGDGRAVTSATEVDGEARVAEIARMLSGATSAVSLEHAKELLASALV